MVECEDRQCQRELKEVHQEVFGIDGSKGLSEKVRTVEDNQAKRTLIIDSKMPKSWLWTIIALVAPVTGIALTILIAQATADSRFADKGIVIKHEIEICELKKVIENHLIAEQRTTEMLNKILEEVKK